MAGFNLMKNIAGMQLLFAQRGSSSTEKPKCHELKDNVKLTDNPNICVVQTGITSVGNANGKVTLDFSQADESTINNFLAHFTDIYGAIIMDGNAKVETLNFGKIAAFQGQKVIPGGIFILIRNNPKLKKIEWDPSIELLNLYAAAGSNIKVLIYNNPNLVFTGQDTDPLKKLDTAVKTQPAIQSYIQSTGAKECEFAYPLPMDPAAPSKYITPTAEFLQNCDKIKGDFIVKDVNMTGLGPFQLSKDACLSLINVDLKDVTFGFNLAGGAKDCKDGTLSNLTNNPNLCGGSMTALKKYYKDMKEIPITLHTATCTMPCVTSNEEYIFCESTPAASTTAVPSVTNAPSGLAVSPSANVKSVLDRLCLLKME